MAPQTCLIHVVSAPMQLQNNPPETIEPVSKVKLALGAASLFLFIVGVKRSYDAVADESTEIGDSDSPTKSSRTKSYAAAEAE
ncbi:hypothetical protein BH23GEM6_BH23GEM6_19480 [soil metagenome]